VNSQALVNSLKHTIDHRKMGLKDISNVSGYTPRQIHKWTSGRKIPSLSEFVDLAETIGYEVTLVRKKTDAASINDTRK
jgi:transcriptional regulator with XRE-family HTH domain|tara:strand:- start:478 stop:714 length:237 start_codon:yes stop_codon:yes gene_type:complete